MIDVRKLSEKELLEAWSNHLPKCNVITGITDKTTGVTIFRKEDIQDLLDDEDLYE